MAQNVPSHDGSCVLCWWDRATTCSWTPPLPRPLLKTVLWQAPGLADTFCNGQMNSHARKGLLVINSTGAHITGSVKQKITAKNSVLVIIPGSMTKIPQPSSVSINYNFKVVPWHLQESWMTKREHSFGRMRNFMKWTNGRVRHRAQFLWTLLPLHLFIKLTVITNARLLQTNEMTVKTAPPTKRAGYRQPAP